MSLVQPQRITSEDFTAYSKAWQKMVNGPDAGMLNSYFTVESGLINYVYLPTEMADELLANTPASIALEFALVPTGETVSFSMLLAGLDSNNRPMEPYYQAGVGGRAALVVIPHEANSVIPYDEAKAWITRWNNLQPDGLGTLQFQAAGDQRLWAYDYDVRDLEGALHSESPVPADAALWFNFVLHEDTPLFGTVLTLNRCPSGTDPGTITLDSSLSYYDVSKPCPPFHILEPSAQQ